MFPADLMLSQCVFHGIGMATKNAKFDLDNQSCLAGMSIESKFEGCLDERAS